MFNQELRQLKEQMLQKKKAEAELADLYVQKETLVKKTEELENVKDREQKDVERLEGSSLAALFYSLLGKTEEKLTKEKEEAYQAAVKYDAAKAELYSVEDEIARREDTVRRLVDSENAYEAAFSAALKKIRAEQTRETEEILAIEAKLYEIECEMREIDEAMDAGRQVMDRLENILGELESADGWATWDTFLGGGLFTDMIKHEHLDNAQQKINELQVDLRRFKTELTDVQIDADIQVQIDGFLRFADYFFDGIFADWTVKDKIESSITRVKHTKNEVCAIISKLEERRSNAKARWEKKAEERENKVLSGN